ncbi:MAG: glycoside hydrolase family 3 protein, partial [Oscillospiraceae bacterium]|nr:glycoside hydrolase family 3 protein [Oscillospiraceae bacterium]
SLELLHQFLQVFNLEFVVELNTLGFLNFFNNGFKRIDVFLVNGLEIKENNGGVWLAPGMNIHRNVLCGRNFEYYSEDPLTTGLFAAAAVKGCQSQGIAATVKHYCANNKDVNRKYVDSRVSQRALREIYLRGFEIAVKKGKPWALMTSYNPVNGVQASANWEAINGILRSEWGFEGVVMTDWDAFSHLPDELYAGSDVKMPGRYAQGYPLADKEYDPARALTEGSLDRGAVNLAARRVFLMMDKIKG